MCVVERNEIPDCFKGYILNKDAMFFDGVYKKEVYGHMAIIKDGNKASIHFEFIKWNHKTRKEAIVDFETIGVVCKSYGCDYLLAVNERVDEKWQKFLDIMGFNPPETYAVAIKKI